MISRDQFAEVKRLFRQAAAMDTTQRRAFLKENCSDAPEVRAEVEALLTRDGVETFLETPAFVEWSEVIEKPSHTGLLGHRIGPYRIVQPIGTGGMAEVFLAHRDDEQYEQKVAVKIVKRGMDTDEILRRFRNERQTLANLDHPHIARLLDGGMTTDGRPYLVMEYIDGKPIDHYCAQRRLNVTERLRLFRGVCSAVAYAHRQLVVHRDLKPNNILVTTDGSPKLLDFGIAKMLDAHALPTMVHTQTGQRLLTPLYASPEQIGAAPISTATDIYSLGVVLYEILTGKRPYEYKTGSPLQLERIICDQDPPRPSTAVRQLLEAKPAHVHSDQLPELIRRRRQLRGDLDTMVMTTLRKEPERRYGSVDQLSDDIRRYLDGLPISARADTVGYRAAKFMRRHLLGVSVAAVFVVLLVASSVVSWSLYAKAQRFAEERRLAEQEATDRLWEAYLAQARGIRNSHRSGRRFASLRILEKAAAIRPELRLRNEAIAALALSDVEMETIEDSEPPRGLVSTEGLREPNLIARATLDGAVSIFSAIDGRELTHLPGPNLSVTVLRFSLEGDYLAVKHHEYEHILVRVWHLKPQNPEVVLELRALPGGAVSFDARGLPRWIAFGQPDETVRFYHLPSGELWQTLPIGMPVRHVSANPSGQQLAVAGVGSAPVQIWDVEHGTLIHSLEAPIAIHGVNWSQDGRLIAGGCENHRIYVWDAQSGSRKGVLEGHQAQTIRVYFDPSGDYLGSQGWDRTTRIWDLRSGEQVLDPIEGWYLMGLGRRFFSSNRSNQLSRWRFEPGEEYSLLHASSDFGRATDLTIGLEGQILATASGKGVVLWDLKTRRQIAHLYDQEADSVLIPPGTQTVLATTEAGLWRWSLEPDGDSVVVKSSELLWDQEGLSSVTFDPNGNLLLISKDGLLSFDSNGATRKIFDRYPGMSGVCMSPNGRWIFTGTWQGAAARVWDTHQGAFVQQFSGVSLHGKFSPDGRWLVVADPGEYRFYKTATWELEHAFELPTAGRRVMDFTSDSSIVALGHSQYVVRLVEVESWRELATLPNPGVHVLIDLCFSPDNKVLAAIAPDRVVQIWNLGLIRKQLRSMRLDWETGGRR